MADAIAVGDVVQIDPAHDKLFGACFLTVTEVKSWGVQGFVRIPARGDAYYRCAFENLYRVGHAEWMPEPADATD